MRRSTQRDGGHALQVVRQKIGAGLVPAGGERMLGDFGVAHRCGMVMQTAQAGDIGNRLDVEYQHRVS